MVIIIQIANIIIRFSSPVVQLIPAESEAIIVENGFIVEHIVPIPEPRKMQARPTIASYLAARKTGIKIG